MEYSKIAVIIPSRYKPLHLEKCIKSFLNLDYPNFEVIIADDGLDSEPKNILRKYEDRIKNLNSYSKGPSFARNLAVKNTDAEFIAFTDSDCIVDKNWLKELLKGLKEYPDVLSCGGIQKLPQDAAKFEEKVFLFMKKVGFISGYMQRIKSDEIRQVNHNPSCNVMYKRDVFLKEGGFLEGLWPGEDVEFDFRLKKKGYKLVFNPRALVYHYRPKNLKAFLKMMHRYGWAQGFLVRRYGIFRKIQALPFLGTSVVVLFFITLFSKFFIFPPVFFGTGLLFLLLYFNFDLSLFILALLGVVYWNIGFFKRYLKL